MRMTPNRRIALNIAATYAHSLYKLVLGLVTTRWLLLALGQMDYGLRGLVGGLAAFVTMINRHFAGAAARYYASSIGMARKEGNQQNGLMECRRWFSVAVSVHTTLPLALLAIGWPLGEYAVGNWLVIPPERLSASLWVWRFTCLSALTAMMNVPFRALYTAKQEIAEMTIYSMAETTVTVFLLYYMVTHPADWLAKYAFLHCLIAIVPRLLICLRAIRVYPECRLRRDCLWRWRDIKELAAYSFWNAYGDLGRIARGQGLAVVVNLFFGAVANAAMAIANKLSARANTFAKSMTNAFNPAIIASFASGNLNRMMGLVFRTDKLSSMMVVVVSTPLFLEVHEVMRLWLKMPPPESPWLCDCVLVLTLVAQMTIGQRVAIAATGKIALNRFLDGTVRLLAIPIAIAFISAGCGLFSIVYAQLVTSMIVHVIHIWNASRLAGVSAVQWFRKVFGPVMTASAISGLVGLLPRLTLAPGLRRVVLTTLACELALLPLVWFVLLDADEKEYIKAKWAKAKGKIARFGKGGASSEGGVK